MDDNDEVVVVEIIKHQLSTGLPEAKVLFEASKN